MILASVLFSFVEGISSELGSLSVPYIQSVACFDCEKGKLMEALVTIKASISDILDKPEKSQSDEVWLENLQLILYDVDDFVEELSDEKQRLVDVNRNMADKIFSFFSTPWFYIVMAFKMKAIRNRLNYAAGNRINFSPGSQVADSKAKNEEREETCSVPSATQIIGRDGDKRAIKELLRRFGNEENVSIIPIIGIGGIGKTALAQVVFNDEEEDAIRFDSKMWVWVSTVFDVKTIVKDVAEAASRTKEIYPKSTSLEILRRRLQQNLFRQRYLLVLDDVWNSSSERWNRLKNVLNCGERGSVILVTTRDKEVARIMGETDSAYELRGLDEDDCWSLFEHQLGFKPENPRLIPIVKKILEKCEGIPLAIMTAAGLLRTLKTEDEWLNVKNQLWKVAQEDEHILPILGISYARLPSYLKKCFAYCSVFPKGSPIEKATLIQMWMAQGFIEPTEGGRLEDIGDRYCTELCQRYFFQSEQMDADGNVISWKMHNVMHDLAQKVAGCQYSIGNDAAVEIPERVIHATVDGSCPEEIPASLVKARRLRTLLWTGTNRTTSVQGFDNLASTYKCLRMLDLREFSFPRSSDAFLCCGSSDVLNSIRELKYLRYLDLSKSAIGTLPNSVCELQHLETLKLNSCQNLEELPRDIEKLANLRHLENRGCDKLKGMPSGIGQLTCIQTLSLFVSGNTGDGGLSELEGLNNLRGELEIKILDNATPEPGKEYLKKKRNLQTLRLYGALFESLQPHPDLKRLQIDGYGGAAFPNWMRMSLPHLVEITLENCPTCDSLPFADQLRSLKVLKLKSLDSLKYIQSHSSDSSSLSFEGGWFPALKEVSLCYLPKLEKWFREEDVGDRKQFLSLNSLAKLTIRHCLRLTSMPLHPAVEDLKLEQLKETLIKSMTEAATICSTSSRPSSKLKSLEIHSIDDLVSLPLENLTSIECLKIDNCNQLNSLSRETHHLTGPDRLRTSKGKQPALSEEDDLQDFRSLHSLQLRSLPSLRSLPKGLQHATKLKAITIYCCDSLVTSLDWMGKIGVQSLVTGGFGKIESLASVLQHLTFSLEKLEICDWPDLNFSDEDNDMPCLRSLHSLQLSGLPNLKSLPKVYTTALKNLKIDKCRSLMTSPDWLGNLTSLQRLEIYDCDTLKSLPEGMRRLSALQELNIRGCPSLSESWPNIIHIPEIAINGQKWQLQPTI